MGKRIITQRRGRGGPRYRAPSHRARSRITYPPNKGIYQEGIGGQVIEIVDDPARTAPVAKVLLENFQEIEMIAPEGIKEGQWIEIGGNADQNIGNVLPVGRIKEGTPVYNIEIKPGDCGKLVRASGTSAFVVSHDREKGVSYLRLPSKKIISINSNSRVSIGRVAGGGRKEKPMVHAGQAYHNKKARNKIYPRVSGVSMNAVDHPFGGKSSHSKGRPSTVARNTPPGRKVGHIAARRTGRKK